MIRQLPSLDLRTDAAMEPRAPDPEALVEAIRGPSPNYKRTAVAALVDSGPDVVPGLLAILDEILADPPAAIERIGEGFDVLYAVVVLSHLQCVEAHRRFLDLARLEPEELEELSGGLQSEGLDRALLATCDRDLSGIRSLVEDPSVDDQIRSQAAQAMAGAVLDGWADRDEILAFLAERLRAAADELPSYFPIGLGFAMLDLSPAEYEAELLAARDSGLIDPMAFDRTDLERAIEEGDGEHSWHAETVRLRDDVHQWMEDWACFEENQGLWRQRTEALAREVTRLAPTEERSPVKRTSARKGDAAERRRKRKRQRAARKKARKKKRGR